MIPVAVIILYTLSAWNLLCGQKDVLKIWFCYNYFFLILKFFWSMFFGSVSQFIYYSATLLTCISHCSLFHLSLNNSTLESLLISSSYIAALGPVVFLVTLKIKPYSLCHFSWLASTHFLRYFLTTHSVAIYGLNTWNTQCCFACEICLLCPMKEALVDVSCGLYFASFCLCV